MKKYFGKYASSGDVQTALDSGALSNPYVAVVGDEMDYNTKIQTDFSTIPLTFEILSDGNIVFETTNVTMSKTIELKINNGEWTSITSVKNGVSFPVVSGDIVQFRGDNTAYGNQVGYYNTFKQTTADFNAKGNILSLISSTGFTTVSALTDYALNSLFINCTHLQNAENLLIPDVSMGYATFSGFLNGCTNMTKGPKLLPATLGGFAYANMFKGCSNLNSIVCLATDISATSCLSNWTYNVSATGTFVKKAGVNWTAGNSGIPNGWTVIEE